MGSEMLFLGHKQEKNKNINFAQTCTRLSQFLKEKRCLGHLDALKTNLASSDLDIKGAKEVFGAMNGSNNVFPKKMEKKRTSLELFPLTSSLTVDGVENSTKTLPHTREWPISKEEPKNTTTTPSMTIFYGGKVLVFNELTEDKAQEIMSLARNGMRSCCSQTCIQAQGETQTPSGININGTKQELVPQGVCSLSDLPIARRVSLHRFMEKRKHRIAANAPYHLQNSSMEMVDSNSQKFNMMRSVYEQQQLELKL